MFKFGYWGKFLSKRKLEEVKVGVALACGAKFIRFGEVPARAQ